MSGDLFGGDRQILLHQRPATSIRALPVFVKPSWRRVDRELASGIKRSQLQSGHGCVVVLIVAEPPQRDGAGIARVPPGFFEKKCTHPALHRLTLVCGRLRRVNPAHLPVVMIANPDPRRGSRRMSAVVEVARSIGFDLWSPGGTPSRTSSAAAEPGSCGWRASRRF